MNRTAEELKVIAAEWRRARRIHLIYIGICDQFSLAYPQCSELDSPIDRAEPEAVANVRKWLRDVDALIQPHQLRIFLQTSALASEPGVRALIERFCHKEERSPTDRDKLDFLLVQYFAQCAPSELLHVLPTLADVARVLEPALGKATAEAPGWLESLDDALRRLGHCGTLREVLRQGILDEVRKIKVGAEEAYFQPAALVAFTRFNFLVRQTFFRLMRADVEAIRQGVRELASRGVTTIDCQRAKLSATEPLEDIAELCRHWKQPFQAEYSAGNPFQQLAELRAAVDESLKQVGMAAAQASASVLPRPASVQSPGATTGASVAATSVTRAPAASFAGLSSAAAEDTDILEIDDGKRGPAAFPARTAGVHPPAASERAVSSATRNTPRASGSDARTAPPVASFSASSVAGFSLEPEEPAEMQATNVRAAAPVDPAAAINAVAEKMGLAAGLRTMLKQLSDYLMADPSRSRTSGATIVIGSARLALSSWEVTAFVDGIEQFSPVIKQGVAVRVLLFQSLERARQGAMVQHLAGVVSLARAAAGLLQEALNESRDNRNIEATVTLSSTVQRLGDVLQDAERFLHR